MWSRPPDCAHARVWTFVFDTARAITVVVVISVGDATSTRLP
jgi:hypothetical protein